VTVAGSARRPAGSRSGIAVTTTARADVQSRDGRCRLKAATIPIGPRLHRRTRYSKKVWASTTYGRPAALAALRAPRVMQSITTRSAGSRASEASRSAPGPASLNMANTRAALAGSVAVQARARVYDSNRKPAASILSRCGR
jgi:hypothetical protein